MRKILFLLAVTSMFGSLGARAASAGKHAYGSAGCGLGSQVMGKDGSQIFASTTNGTSGSQTFGISSGTSNCTDGGTVAERYMVPTYVEANREPLATDIARGEGETLAGLAHVMGCSDVQELSGALKRNYRTIFPADSASGNQVTEAIFGVVRQDSRLHCLHTG